jgi:glycosyltransferase involved in cell wall biosynthesis
MYKPRIYVAIDTFLPLVGGAEKQAFLQSRYLREQGFEVTVITMHYKQEWPKSEILDDVPVLRVAGQALFWRECMPGIVRRLCYLLALLAMGWQLWMHRSNYDILHVFQLTPFTLPALLVCRLARKPLVVAMRCEYPDAQADKPDRSRYLRTGADLEALERLGKPILLLINRQLRLVRAHLTILSRRMYANLDKCGLTGAKVVLIPNGVDIERFQPHAWTCEEPLTVICVAKLRYQKGIDVLLRSWRALLKQLPEAKLIIVGDGPLLVSLQRLASNLGIASSVDFTGLCADMASQYRRGHIAVLPSRWEGMPNALLEAMSCGLACIATRVSGSEDLLCEGVYGLLVEPEDIGGLASAMLRLLREPELARYYGQAARQHIEQYYAFKHIMHKYIKLYRQIINEHQ